MSSLYRIRTLMTSLTPTEHRLAEYILLHKDKVVQMSVHDLADSVAVSPSAVVRFSKKIGYEGFMQLKVELAKDHSDTMEDFMTQLIEEDDAFADILRKAQSANQQTIHLTYGLLQMTQLEVAVETLSQAQRIFLIGFGGSSIVAADFHQKLIRINKPVRYFAEFHLLISALSHVQKGDVVVAFSYSGTTHDILVAVREAKKRGAIILGITQVGAYELSNTADMVLNIPKEEESLRLGSIASRNAMLVVSDILYLGLISSDKSQSRDLLIRTHETMNKFSQ